MARRYVPKTYNNRRVLRLVFGAVITLALAVVILFLILFFIFQRYVEEGQLRLPWNLDGTMPPTSAEPEVTPDADEVSPTPTVTPTPAATPEATPDDPEQGTPEKYTIEQMQNALQAQFGRNAFGERNPEVISFEEVERDRDFIALEGAGPDAPAIDLTESSRYKVEIRFEQPIDEYNIWQENYQDEESSPFRRDGNNHTIMTEYFYINDSGGAPVLAFLMD